MSNPGTASKTLSTWLGALRQSAANPWLSHGLITAILTCAIAFVCLFFLMTNSVYWNISPDSYAYYTSAKTLLDRGVYEINNRPLIEFPPGYPAILAAEFLLFGRSYFTLNATIKVFAIMCGVITYLVLRQLGMSKNYALALTLLFLTNVMFIREAYRALSDLPYMLFSLTALYLFGEHARKGWAGFPKAAALFTILSYFTRIIGLSLMIAALVYAFLQWLQSEPQKRRRRAFVLFTLFLAFLTPVAAWEARNHLASGVKGSYYLNRIFESEAYGKESTNIEGVAERIISQLVPYKFFPTAEIFANGWHMSLAQNTWIAAGSILAAAAYLGLLLDVLRRRSLAGLYLLAYLSALVISPQTEGERYFIPVLPLLLFYSAGFIKEAASRCKVPWGLVAVLGLLYLALYFRETYGMLAYQYADGKTPAFPGTLVKYGDNLDEEELDLWLRANTNSSYACASERFDIDGLISGRLFLFPEYSQDANQTLNSLRDEHVDCFILDKNSPRMQKYLIPVIEANKDKFKLVLERKMARLYALQGGLGAGN